ncbi:MAG TPA: GHKL domain-containing protein [Thermoanaerobacterales bacterium]|nr:GHKL domain-containing protein [Thermoanaerobacterales bacterium]
MANDRQEMKTEIEKSNHYNKYFTKTSYTIKQDPPLFVKEGSHRVIIKYQDEADKTFEYDVGLSVIEDTEGHLGYLVSVEDTKKLEEKKIKKAELERWLTEKQIAASYVHELRNPLFSIRGFLQILKQSFVDDDKRKEYTDIALNELDRMNNLLSDYLSRYKEHNIINGRVNRCISVKNIIEELIVFFQHSMQLKGISYTLEFGNDELLVSIDKEQLTQVLINIIQNAIDAMSNGDNLTIKAFKEDNWVCVEITDEGVGIKQDDLDKIFVPFFSTKEKGTGLGLYITKQIMDSNGGSINIVSEEGKGTTVFLKFPEAKQNQ